MKNKYITEAIKNALIDSTPNVLERVIKTPIAPVAEDVPIDFTIRRGNKNYLARTLILIASLCIVLFGGFKFYMHYFSINSVVTLDINPSIELSISGGDRVLEVKSYNSDGILLVDPKSVRFKKSYDAMNIVLTSLYNSGYIGQNNKSDMIIFTIYNSFMGSNPSSAKIRGYEYAKNTDSSIDSAINDFMSRNNINTNVYFNYGSKGVTDDIWALDEIDSNIISLKNNYNLSMGRAMYISQVLMANEQIDAATISSISVDDISKLMIAKQLLPYEDVYYRSFKDGDASYGLISGKDSDNENIIVPPLSDEIIAPETTPETLVPDTDVSDNILPDSSIPNTSPETAPSTNPSGPGSGSYVPPNSGGNYYDDDDDDWDDDNDDWDDDDNDDWDDDWDD